MNYDLVIKVKYGDTLRRFTSIVQGNGSLNIDMNGLRAKILGLFKIAADGDVSFTYIDEDNDVVALVDDDDLCDAIKQRLNPLRINVLLKSKKVKKTKLTEASSSEATAPMRSTRSQTHPFSQLNDAITKLTDELTSKAMSSVPVQIMPEHFGNAFSKLSQDLASKAASSAPVLSELVESLAKLGLTQLGQVSNCQAGTTAEATMKNGEISMGNNDSKSSEPKNKTKVADCNNVTRSVGTSACPISTSLDLNVNLPKDPNVGKSVPVVLGSEFDDLKKLKKDSGGKSVDSSTLFHPYNDSQGNSNWQPWFLAPTAAMLPVPPVGTIGSSSTANGEECPKYFSNTDGNSSAPHGTCPRQRGADAFRRFPVIHQRDNMGRIFHKGVVCDGCGVHPITGPRFKSKVKQDYDLCNICYLEMGDPADYYRMDIPMSYSRRCGRSMKGLRDHHLGFQKSSVKAPRDSWTQQLSLDSQFIQDVNVVDGTLMPPLTPFIKIWRMHNNGIVSWPRGTQLVWIGGEQISVKTSVDIGVPAYGCPVGSQLDVAVDFTAPDRPGKYISYWRMALPSGVKFGQCVWVLIHVESSLENSISESSHSLNLNLPPECSSPKSQIIDVNVKPEEELVKPMADTQPSKDQELDFPTNDSLLVNNGNSVSAPVTPEVPTVVTPEVPEDTFYPIIDLSPAPYEPYLVPSVTEFSEEVNNGDTIEEALLKELEEMGFKQIDLNKEVLRTHQYDLERSVEELCGMSEWDPILEELQEMGFNDKVTNTKLLVKNAGSIKRVVMDLISGENAQ
ncbi:hypothetical protein GIB67_004419 [Kingdonia uniflora]|uniref:NBR1 n=1 Tax=Kingdonia uniflora TaxID=39325 RepID=A0A7J7MRE6_9MAGN|nr:hypothetical protein GIB67_004419 [Kingdonia uniflora]